MISNKTKIKLLEERSDQVKLKFPSIEVPVQVSKRYFKKIKRSDQYEIKKEQVF